MPINGEPSSSGDFNWDALASWAVAVGTLLAVLVALFAERIWRWWERPKLIASFQQEEPFCRRTRVNPKALAPDLGLGGGDTEGYWIRVSVKNQGRSPALRCIGKVMEVITDDQARSDRDPMQLRWCGVPDDCGFEPIHLAPNEHEYLNVIVAFLGLEPNVGQGPQIASRLRIDTFRDAALGFPPTLDLGKEHKIKVTIFADNALAPAQITLKIKWDGGKFESVEVTAE